ncbi:MAG: lytic transglycosylase domain-containing protein [Treponema sp.]
MAHQEINEFGKSCRNSIIFFGTVLTAAFTIAATLPPKAEEVPPLAVKTAPDFESDDTAEFALLSEETGFNTPALYHIDNGLTLYRQPASRGAVEWFYMRVTGSKETAAAILREADRNDIPLSLAFSLAYAESRYKATAVNTNKNATVDRGLFQLNSRTFPKLSEEEFFNPAISAKYGMAHLRFCINAAGNEVAALCMYNAGTAKVRSNNTPQSTLNYAGKIMAHRKKIDALFDEEVAAYYENAPFTGIALAYAGKNR